MGRIRGRFARVEPRRRARAFVRAAGGPAAQERLEASPSRSATPTPTACSTCWAGPTGTPTRSATTCAPTSSSPWRPRRRAGRRRDRLPQEGHHVGRGAAAVHRHGRADRERPGRRLPGLRRHAAGHAFLDRALYLPEWTADPDRCQAAGVPGGRGLRHQAGAGTAMLERAFAAGVPAAGSPATRSTAATRAAALAGGPPGPATCWRSPARTGCPTGPGTDPCREMPPACPGGPGSGSRPEGRQGPPLLRLGLVASTPPADAPGHRWLLIRRNLRTGELRLLPLLLTPPGAARHPGPGRRLRWRVEECFQTGKGLAGLDEHQVRRWTSWHRWVTLAMLAHAFLAVIAAANADRSPPPGPS